MLSNLELKQIRGDWKAVLVREEQFSEEFYKQLFQRDPQLEHLFKRSLEMQKRKLVSMFSAAFDSFDQPRELFPLLRMAGRRHNQYDVKPADYKTMEEAFMAALTAVLSDKMDISHHQSWRKAFGDVAKLMQGDAPDLP
jgi:hemoglobin-like flavoprotein